MKYRKGFRLQTLGWSDGNTFDERIISSELYVGIQKSDSVTELIGNVMTFFVAFGFSFVGDVIRTRKCDRKVNT